MKTNRQIAGQKAKLDGHVFENTVQQFLSNKIGTNIIVEGASGTKVDVRSEDNKLRFSIKKTPTDLQVGLITQKNFIDALNIKDNKILNFISNFFGGDHVSEFNRHRKTSSEVGSKLSDHFLNFMNNNIMNILKVAVTHGSLNQTDDVNYILFPKVKHDAESLQKINAKKMLKDFEANGIWTMTETTLHFHCHDVKVMSLQMFGSGRKFSNGYHSLQFRIACGKIKGTYVSAV